MPPRRPRKVHIGPHTHPIAWPATIVPDPDDPDQDPSDPEANKHKLGESLLVAGGINIRTQGQGTTQQASTLLHEILHHIFNDSAIDETAGWNPAVEEFVIRTLEGRLLELFVRKENRPVVAWLAAASNG